MYILGIDLGSRCTKAVIIDNNYNLLSGLSCNSDTAPDKVAHKIIQELLKKLSLQKKDITYIVSTGYGRDSLTFRNKSITEITCHGAGAHYFYPKTRSIIDIGGQDSKVISINDKGKPVDFAMNDKCAAGTGKFLEMMARTMNIPTEDLGTYDKKAKKNISINSICTVFAESEVISLMAEKESKENIIRGLHKGIAERTIGLLERVGMRPEVTMSGGVARNTGVVKAIENIIDIKLNIPPSPELIGAFGAAILGCKMLKGGKNEK